MMTKFNQSEFSEGFRVFDNDSIISQSQSMVQSKDYLMEQTSANANHNVDNTSFSFSDNHMFQRFGISQTMIPHHQPSLPILDRSKIATDNNNRSSQQHMLMQKNLQLTQITDSFQPPRHHSNFEDHHQQHLSMNPQSPDSASLTDYDESSSLSSEEHVLTPLACAAAGQSRPCLTWACKACKKKSVAVDRRKAATLRERRRLRKVSTSTHFTIF